MSSIPQPPEELEAPQPPRGHVRIIYLGPVAPHWELESEFGERALIEEFRQRALARLVLLPPHDPQFRRNRGRGRRPPAAAGPGRERRTCARRRAPRGAAPAASGGRPRPGGPRRPTPRARPGPATAGSGWGGGLRPRHCASTPLRARGTNRPWGLLSTAASDRLSRLAPAPLRGGGRE